MFPCPSPKGSNHAGLYLNRAGELVDRKGSLWGKRGTMALDELPDSLRAIDKTPRRRLARDEEPDEFAELLRGKGLDEEAIAVAQWLAERARQALAQKEEEPEGEDKLPISGPRHAALARESREPGEKVFRGRDHAEYLRLFPELQRSPSVAGSSQFENDAQMVDRRRRLAGDAAARSDTYERMFGDLLAQSRVTGRTGFVD
jgi:hypothetical protein